MLELRDYLRTHGEQFSFRELSRLTGVRRDTVSERISIATGITPDVLQQAGVTADQIAFLPHSTLLQIAEMPTADRLWSLWDAVHGAATLRSGARPSSPAPSEQRGGGARRPTPSERSPLGVASRVSRDEASHRLRSLATTVAQLAESLIGTGRSHYVAQTGHGGFLIYLAPER